MLQAFLQQRGLDAWASRMIETDPVPPAATSPSGLTVAYVYVYVDLLYGYLGDRQSAHRRRL